MRIIFATLACLALFTTAAHADSIADQQAYLTGYAGVFNVTDSGGTTSGQFGMEYRFEAIEWGIRPMVGANVDWDGGAYGYAGLNWDIEVFDQFYLIPNFAVGLYHDGGSKDLGGPIEFRSGLELAYQFDNAHRLGVVYNHVSNASIYDKNPGAEAALVTYSIPLSDLF